jgi:hypothetical protein
MALNISKNFEKTVQIGTEITESISTTIDSLYCKISKVSGNKEKIVFVLDYTKDGTCYEKMKFSFIPDVDDFNYLKQGYEHLKTLPEFADAVDV